jgi:uncharacterized protein (DUF1499 family)
MSKPVVIACLILAALAVVIGFIRLAPSDPEIWHKMPRYAADQDFSGAAFRIRNTGPEGLAQLDAAARATPRTKVLNGSVPSGMVTYVTRSRVFGFPDYTTAQQAGDTLKVFGRSRFGDSDFGVNRARIKGWLSQIDRAAAGG